MSGKWGVSMITPTGWYVPGIIYSYVWIQNFNVSALIQQVKSMGASWLLINLSSGSSGDTYLSYHPILYYLNPGSTPPNVTSGGRDLFYEIATALQSAGIRCLVYMGAQGPALLKLGPSKAYDALNGSQSVTNWINWVNSNYGNNDTATLEKAYAQVIVAYYANLYGDLIDGWWFDQSNFANISLLHSIIKLANPNTVAIFNDGIHVPLYNSQPGLEDATVSIVIEPMCLPI